MKAWLGSKERALFSPSHVWTRVRMEVNSFQFSKCFLKQQFWIAIYEAFSPCLFILMDPIYPMGTFVK